MSNTNKTNKTKMIILISKQIGYIRIYIYLNIYKFIIHIFLVCYQSKNGFVSFVSVRFCYTTRWSDIPEAE